MGNLLFFYGLLFALAGQIVSFLQLQCGIKYGWYDKYPLLILFSAVPGLWFYIKSVNYFITYFNGNIFPVRLIGFSIGIVVFTIMARVLFGEQFTLKTLVSFTLAFTIVLIQIYWK